MFFVAQGLHVEGIGILKFVYPAVWGLSQIVTGPLADRLGRKRLIASGMIVQAVSIWLILATGTFAWWIARVAAGDWHGDGLSGAACGGERRGRNLPWRARSLGVYRFWRDMGYAIGALLAGLMADLLGLEWAIGVVGGLTLCSGIVTAFVMRETRRASLRGWSMTS